MGLDVVPAPRVVVGFLRHTQNITLFCPPYSRSSIWRRNGAVAPRSLSHLLGGTLSHNGAATAAAFRTDVHDVVRIAGDIQLVCSMSPKTVLPWSTSRWSTLSSMSTSWKCSGPWWVRRGCRQGVAGVLAGQFRRQLHALGLPHRRGCGGRLAEGDVSQAHISGSVPQTRLESLGWASKNTKASSTVMSSTSAMDLPSVTYLGRFPGCNAFHRSPRRGHERPGGSSSRGSSIRRPCRFHSVRPPH